MKTAPLDLGSPPWAWDDHSKLMEAALEMRKCLHEILDMGEYDNLGAARQSARDTLDKVRG